MTSGKPGPGAKWTTLPYHRRWLIDQASGLFDFFEAESIDPEGRLLLPRRRRPANRRGQGPRDPRHHPHGPLLRHRPVDGPARRRPLHRPRHGVPVARPPRHGARRLCLGRRRRRPQAGLWPCLRPPRRLERQAGRPPRCRPPPRRRDRGAEDAFLGAEARRLGARNSPATGRRSAPTAARTRTCTSPRRPWPPTRRPATGCISTGPSRSPP